MKGVTLLKIEQFQNWCIFTIIRPFWLKFWFFKNFWSGFKKSVQPENDFVVKKSLRKTYFSKRKVDTLLKIEQFQNWCIFTIVRPFWLNFWFFKNFWSGFRKSVQPENDFVVKKSLRKTYFSKRKVDTLPKIEQFQNWCIFTIVTWEK